MTAHGTRPPSVPPAPDRAAHAALATVALAQFLLALDYSIIYVALPTIARDLRLGPAVAQWVVSAYAVFFAGFLMVGGRLTDRVGARRLFLVAITLFGVASAVGGAAGDGAVLLTARAGQGLGAALLQPAVLGLIGTAFPAGPSRSRALAVWGSVGASGLAVGALLGGLLTTTSWRLTFLINLPLAVPCAVGAVRWFGRGLDAGETPPVPALASTLGTAAALALVLALTFGADQGWGAAATLATVGLALLLTVAFVVNERTASKVLVEHALRRVRSLWSGIAATALYMASVGSEFYLVTLLVQSGKGYTGTLHGDSYVADLLPGLVLSGFGHGVIYTSMSVVGTRDVPSRQQGAAGALLTTSQYLSAAVTVAVLTLVLGAAPHHGRYRAAFLLTAAAAVGGVVVTAARR